MKLCKHFDENITDFSCLQSDDAVQFYNGVHKPRNKYFLGTWPRIEPAYYFDELVFTSPDTPPKHFNRLTTISTY